MGATHQGRTGPCCRPFRSQEPRPRHRTATATGAAFRPAAVRRRRLSAHVDGQCSGLPASRRLDFKKTAPRTHSGGDGPHRRGSGGCSPNRTPPGSVDTWSSSVVPRASSVTVVSTASASRSRIGSRRSPHPIGFPPGRVTRAGVGVMLKGCGAQRRPGRARSAEPRDLPARGGGRAVRRPAARQRRGVPRLWRLRSVSGGPVPGPPSAR